MKEPQKTKNSTTAPSEPLRALRLQPPSFALLVKQLRSHLSEAEAFEINLDTMRVKGDLAVIQAHFKKPFIARSTSKDLLRRAIKAGFPYFVLAKSSEQSGATQNDLDSDLEFTTLVTNKKAQQLFWNETKQSWENSKNQSLYFAA